MGTSAGSTLPLRGPGRSPRTPYVPLSLSRTFSWLRSTRVSTTNYQTAILRLFNQSRESYPTTEVRTRTTLRVKCFPRLTIGTRLRSTRGKPIPSTRLSTARPITNKCMIMRELSSLLHYSLMTLVNRLTQVYAISQDLNRHIKCKTKRNIRKRLSLYGTRNTQSASFLSPKNRSLLCRNRALATWSTSIAMHR